MREVMPDAGMMELQFLGFLKPVGDQVEGVLFIPEVIEYFDRIGEKGCFSGEDLQEPFAQRLANCIVAQLELQECLGKAFDAELVTVDVSFAEAVPQFFVDLGIDGEESVVRGDALPGKVMRFIKFLQGGVGVGFEIPEGMIKIEKICLYLMMVPFVG